MQTSTHIRPAIHYSQIGPGGWHCLCCAPQSGNKYASRAKAQLRRQAKKRERAAFMREQHHLYLATATSILIEEWDARTEEDEAKYERRAAQEEAERLKEEAWKEARRKDQWFLSRIGDGALFWETPAADVWRLSRVWYDSYDQYDDNWSDYPEATICIDRATLQWVIKIGSDEPEMVLPYMEHDIEDLQLLVRVVVRVRATDRSSDE